MFLVQVLLRLLLKGRLSHKRKRKGSNPQFPQKVLKPFGMIHGDTDKVCIKELNELFIQYAHFWTCVPPILFKDRRQIPPL